MKKIIFVSILIIFIIISCDRWSGITIKYNYENVTISIGEIYNILEDNLDYVKIELVYRPETKSGGKIIKPYEVIELSFNGFRGITIDHINSDRAYANSDTNYLFISSRGLGGTDKKTMERLNEKMNEIIDILVKEYPQCFTKEKFIFRSQ